MGRKPFGTWVLTASLGYVGIAIAALTIQAALIGALDATFASFTVPFIVLFIIGSAGTLMERRWGLWVGLVGAVAFFALLVPFSLETLGNPADPSFWILISGIPALGLAIVFAVMGIRAREGMLQVPSLASARSLGGLLAVGVLGFAVGGILVGSIAGGLIGSLVGEIDADIRIVRGADNPQLASPYSPGTLTVAAGTTITWVNQDIVIHTVTSDVGLFDSGSMLPGDRFSFTFTTPGTFTYGCIPHPFMRGTVVVT
ncbi:MAG: plastocyanin/azurin family copper-binding protein [Thermoplasmata archaeon]